MTYRMVKAKNNDLIIKFLIKKGFVATLHFVKKGFLCNLELQNK